MTSSLTNYPVEAVMVGGTKDPLWDSRRAAATKLQITELPDADHALHVTGDWRGSVSALEQTLTAVERFAIAARCCPASSYSAAR